MLVVDEAGVRIVDGAGRAVYAADSSAGTLTLPGTELIERDDRFTYDTIDGAAFPHEPDLLLAQHALLTGLRVSRPPGCGCVVSAPSRLPWPATQPALAHPAAIVGEGDAWQWPFDPLFTAGEERVPNPDAAWVTDYPPLLGPRPLIHQPAEPGVDRLAAAVHESATDAGLTLAPLPGDCASWQVLRAGTPLGLAELDPDGTLTVTGIDGSTTIRASRWRGRLPEIRWAELLRAPQQPIVVHRHASWTTTP